MSAALEVQKAVHQGRLKNPPLVEAILELGWAFEKGSATGLEGDPHYRLLLGRFFDRVKEGYPYHEPLPTSAIPDDMVAHTVQHRFRVKADGWPLLQLGPGILTVNETSGYTWADFERRCQDAVSMLWEAHPAPAEFRVEGLTLRYIDAVAFDFEKDSVFRFLRDMMSVTLGLPDRLFADRKVSPRPSALNWQVSFASTSPAGTVTLRLATGRRNQEPSLVWETLVGSQGSQVPELPAQLPKWLSEAHAITHDWFSALIEGELERRFSGD